MNQQNLNNLISEALAIEADEARKAGALGYMARALVQATLPHSKVAGNEFKRRNGAFKLTMLADSEVGLPYGSIPRLLVAWITTEAVRTKEREIILGHTLSKFMSELDLMPTGGRWGSITRLREQMKKLFSASISCTYDDGKNWAIKNVQPVTSANLWWDPKNPNQASLFQSTVTLGEEFFKEAIMSPIPVDMRALKALRRSPMALDIYCWLTYRMSYLRAQTSIPWGALQVQFGSDYASNTQGTRDFKRAFLRELKKVGVIYPEAKIDNQPNTLILKPSKPHVSSIC
jgi:hypothetical protein